MAKDIKDWDDDSQEGSGEAGGADGKSGQIGFRVQTETYRDDLLAPSELKHLLQVHQDVHKLYVDKQKLLRKERAAIKEGRKDQAAQYRSTLGSGGIAGASRYKKHPISSKAQFSGIDKQVSAIPTNFEADTNADLRDKLENRYNPRYQPTQRFNPKPRPY